MKDDIKLCASSFGVVMPQVFLLGQGHLLGTCMQRKLSSNLLCHSWRDVFHEEVEILITLLDRSVIH
jgi:hypothetical protein